MAIRQARRLTRVRTSGRERLLPDHPIIVGSDTFIQTAEADQGVVTGVFAGPLHEGMVGTQEQEVATRGFGGIRENWAKAPTADTGETRQRED